MNTKIVSNIIFFLFIMPGVMIFTAKDMVLKNPIQKSDMLFIFKSALTTLWIWSVATMIMFLLGMVWIPTITLIASVFNMGLAYLLSTYISRSVS